MSSLLLMSRCWITWTVTWMSPSTARIHACMTATTAATACPSGHAAGAKGVRCAEHDAAGTPEVVQVCGGGAQRGVGGQRAGLRPHRTLPRPPQTLRRAGHIIATASFGAPLPFPCKLAPSCRAAAGCTSSPNTLETALVFLVLHCPTRHLGYKPDEYGRIRLEVHLGGGGQCLAVDGGSSVQGVCGFRMHESFWHAASLSPCTRALLPRFLHY